MSRASRQSDAPSLSEVQRHYEELAAEYDSKANRACSAAYSELVSTKLRGRRRVIELGAGSGKLLSEIDAELSVACDLSPPMLSIDESACLLRVNADAQRLPFPQASFDAIYSINLLEHVPSPLSVVTEAYRILEPGGLFLAVTPNGDVEALLNLLESLHLKLPEGPHNFISTKELGEIVENGFRLLEHRTFLVFPAGPKSFVTAVDRWAYRFRLPGLFQYLVAQKPMQ